MQLYRGMDIGTAKLTVAERRGVPHHLLDVLDVHRRRRASPPTSAQARARRRGDRRARPGARCWSAARACTSPAVVDALEFPGTDPALRARLEAELDEHGPHGSARPPGRASTRPPRRRSCRRTAAGIVRALEVVELTGGPFQAALPELGADGPGARGCGSA